jgi:hypothetical protein
MFQLLRKMNFIGWLIGEKILRGKEKGAVRFVG